MIFQTCIQAMYPLSGYPTYTELKCVVPENIHTLTMEGIGNSEGEGGGGQNPGNSRGERGYMIDLVSRGPFRAMSECCE